MIDKESINGKIKRKFEKYYGKSVDELKALFNITSNAKSVNRMIVSEMFKFENFSDKELDFINKMFNIKTVRINSRNKIKEHMSFPKIDYFDIYKNTWHDSEIYELFKKTFIFFRFKEFQGNYFFENITIRDLPNEDLNQVFLIWDKIKTMLINNEIEIGGKHGFSVINFQKNTFNQVAHIRPHDTNMKVGKVLLPDGKMIANYCFWLNNKYLEKLLID